MRTGAVGALLISGLLGLSVILNISEAGAAAYQVDLCSRKTGKRQRVTVLNSNSEFLDVLNEDGERVGLPAAGYEQCQSGSADHFTPVPVEPPIAPADPKSLDTLKITGSSTVGQGTLPYFISGYAKKVGVQFAEEPTDDPLRRTYALKKTAQDAPFLRIIVKSTGSNTALPDMIGK